MTCITLVRRLTVAAAAWAGILGVVALLNATLRAARSLLQERPA